MNFVEHALAIAARGLYVHPCRPGTKVAILKSWPNEATRDELDIRELWAQFPKANIGVAGRGCVFIDIDTYKGVTLADLERLGPLPKTLIVRSARGGLHIYFRSDEIFGNSSGDLPPGIDVRGHRGYVLGPGSVYQGGAYEIIQDAPIAPLPEWLAEILKRPATRLQAAGSVQGETDHPLSIAAAREYLKTAPVAIEGENGNNRTYQVCCKLKNFALSDETCFEVLEDWNSRCVPPWDDDELTRIIRHAHKYVQGGIGRDNPAHGFDVIEEISLEDDPFLRSIVTYDDDADDVAAMPPRQWLAPGKLIRGKLTSIVAPGASGKSLLTLQWAASFALGPDHEKTLDICGLETRERVNVLVVNAEDDTTEMRMRMAAVIQRFNLPRDEIRKRVFLQSSQDDGAPSFIVARRNERRGALKETETVQRVIDFCKARDVGVIIVDPFVDSHEGNENDNGEMQQVMRVYRRIAAAANVAVVLVHHARKPGAAGSDGYAGNADAGRGASAVNNAVRFGMTLFKMSEKDAQKYNVAADARRHYVRLDDSKANLHLASPHASWFKTETVYLPNGEGVGVLVPAKLSEQDRTEHLHVLSILASQIDVGERVVMERAAKLLNDHDEYATLTLATCRNYIAEAIGALETPCIDGKRFKHERGASKTGGTIFVTSDGANP